MDITYQVQRNTRSRNIRLRITSKAEVIVSAPPRVPDRMIASFVSTHQDWIQRHLAKINARKIHSNPDLIMVFGKQYQKIIHTDKNTSSHPIYIQGDELHIYPVTTTASSVQRTVETFFKTTAQKYIVPRTRQLAETMEINYTNITLRDQKTRWGSCSSQGGLNFNWRLVQYPTAVIDYVIIHELAHRREMNHSARFWAIVAKFDPEYQSHRRWLQKYGSTVD